MVASILFLIRRLVLIKVDFEILLTPVNVTVLVILPVLTVVVICLNSYCWRMSLQLFSKKYISVGDTFYVYAKANIMKYLPGNIGHYAGRQLFGEKLGMKQTELALASFLEVGYSAFAMLFCAFGLSAQTVWNELHKRFSAGVFLWFGVGLCLLLAGSVVLLYIFRKYKYAAILWNLFCSVSFWKYFIASLLLTAVGSLLLVMINIILLNQYAALDFHLMFLSLAANLAAVFIGFITPGVPGGLGVREAVLTGILSPFFSEDIVILTAVIYRIAMILGDFLAVPVSKVFAVDCNLSANKNNGRSIIV